MDTIHSTSQKVPDVRNTEACDVAKKLSKLNEVAIMIDEDKLATKKDLVESRALTNKDFAEFKSEIRKDIAESRAATKVDIAESKAAT